MSLHCMLPGFGPAAPVANALATGGHADPSGCAALVGLTHC